MAFAEDIHKHKHIKLKNVGPDDHHRKWGLFDEPSWIRTQYLPLGKFSKVGVSLISLGGWHVSWVSHPRVIFNEADGKYWVYFAGGNTNRSIGLATGTSLKSALTEITDGIGGTSRVLDSSGTAGAFDETGVSYPAVIYDPLESDSNKRWKMLFNGRNAAGEYADIGYAYSPDGKSWTKYAGNPVIDLADSCEAPTLVRAGNKFYCIYRRAGAMYISYSDDCITWTEWGSILNVGSAGAWDDNTVAYPTLYFDQGTWYMCYGGHDGSIYQIGLASSQKFFESAWFKLPFNPVLSESPDNATSGCLIRMEDEFLMVYESNDPNRAIRSATIP